MNNFLFPLNAIHRNGEVVLLYTLDEVYSFIKKYGRFYDQHVEWYWYFVDGRYVEHNKPNDWILRDDRGSVVRYDDIPNRHDRYHYWNKRNAEIRKIAEKGLPIPGTGGYRKCWKMNHTAKKNSGAGHRNRNRALCEYDRKEYGIKNKYGSPRSWEN
jgi:hypothetical protein